MKLKLYDVVEKGLNDFEIKFYSNNGSLQHYTIGKR